MWTIFSMYENGSFWMATPTLLYQNNALRCRTLTVNEICLSCITFLSVITWNMSEWLPVHLSSTFPFHLPPPPPLKPAATCTLTQSIKCQCMTCRTTVKQACQLTTTHTTHVQEKNIWIHTHNVPGTCRSSTRNKWVCIEWLKSSLHIPHLQHASTVKIIQRRCGHANKPQEYSLSTLLREHTQSKIFLGRREIWCVRSVVGGDHSRWGTRVPFWRFGFFSQIGYAGFCPGLSEWWFPQC